MLSFSTSMGSTAGTENAAANITLDKVIDPASPGVQTPPPAGERDVELKVTVANVGSQIIPDLGAGDDHILSIAWALDPDITNADGVPVFQNEGIPTVSCKGALTEFVNGIAPGQTVTGCVEFYNIPKTTQVTGASALLLYGGDYSGTPSEWVIS